MTKIKVKVAKLLLQALGFNIKTGLEILKDNDILHCCKKDDCFNPYYGKELCKMHYAKKFRREQGW